MLHRSALQPETWEWDEEAWCCDEEGCECCEEDTGNPNDLTGFEQKADVQLHPGTASLDLHSAEGEVKYPIYHKSRTLFHPSFEAYYEAVALRQASRTTGSRKIREGGFNLNNGDYYYTDPLLRAGHRVYNCLSPASHSIFCCFQLNTPPPIMSPCVYTSSIVSSTFMPQESLPSFPLPQSKVAHNQWATTCESVMLKTIPVDTHCTAREENAHVTCLTQGGSKKAHCTAAEADAVCALLSLSGAYPLPAGN